MIQLDEKKLAKLKTTNQLLDEKYGKHGTASRESFNERTMAWYYGDILRERRKELKLTQKQLAQKIGKDVRNLPAVGRRDEHPRPVGVQRGRRVIFDVFIRGDQIVAERGGEALGNIAAVAGAGVIDDHNTSPKVRFLPSIAHPRPDFQPDVVSARPVCYNGENTATYGRDRICIGIPSGRRSRSRSTRPRRSSPPSCC